MLRAHYRQPIDWTVSALEEAEKTLDRWYDAVGDAAPGAIVEEGILEALNDDLNLSAAIAELHGLTHSVAAGRAEARRAPAALKAGANLLGLLTQTKSERASSTAKPEAATANQIGTLLAERAAARANKNWRESDRLRDELEKMGVAVKDGKNGTTWELRR
jgi:cysteinyl-tRNA synthetase